MNQAVPYKIKYEVYPEGELFVARCLDIDVATDGATDIEALDNLREAIELYFERNAELLIPVDQDDADDAQDESD